MCDSGGNGDGNTSTWDGYNRFNEIPIAPEKNVQYQPTQTKEEMLREKFQLLRKLESLEQKGVQMLAAFLLFYITKFYGRVWCGFTCPQTIWMLMFNWIERRIEGTPNKSKYLNSQPLSLNKCYKKALKHFIWGAGSKTKCANICAHILEFSLLCLINLPS